jgi:Protein of unknown function (DUF3761)
MRILLLVSSFLVYYLSSSTHTDYQDFQESEQNSAFQYENNPSSFNTYSKNISDENEVEDVESYVDQSEDDDSEVQKENIDYVSDDNPVTWDEDPDNYPIETPDTYENVDDEEVQSPTHYNAIPEGACAICLDGTYSFSKNKRGTCSHHGGVAKWLR